MRDLRWSEGGEEQEVRIEVSEEEDAIVELSISSSISAAVALLRTLFFGM